MTRWHETTAVLLQVIPGVPPNVQRRFPAAEVQRASQVKPPRQAPPGPARADDAEDAFEHSITLSSGGRPAMVCWQQIWGR
jgi:hypothetical protein